MVNPNAPVSELNRVGSKTATVLKKLNILTCEDLLWYLPVRYDDLSKTTTIQEAPHDERVTIRGHIISISSVRTYRKKLQITKATIEDDSASLSVTWFGQKYIDKTLSEGDEVYLSGVIKKDLTGFTMTNPVFEKVRSEQLHTGAVVPIYRLTAGLSQKQIRFLIKSAIENISTVPDDLPKSIREAEKLLPLRQALSVVHWPTSDTELEAAMRRLKFEELFWLQLHSTAATNAYEIQHARIHELPESELKSYLESLPFKLTGDQFQVVSEIQADMKKQRPMNRLVEGDVGSGKTVVASVALLNAAINGYQSALMAPTELLAQQHYAELLSLFSSYSAKLQIALRTGSQAMLNGEKISKKKLSERIANDEVHIVVGTHALIQDSIKFSTLGVVIIDEQHRFGVEQRKKLTLQDASGTVPHLLSLTATPIPRTLALTLYGELDISIIKEKPKGRKPIITKLVDEHNRQKAYNWIRQKVQKGQQVFVLCPLIDESDTSESKSVLAEHKRLSEEVFPDLTVQYVHGKMKADDKQQTLVDFKDQKFPMLVTTSVIEVGIDIPNATIMVIEGAERFGLAQLHQFRGRVGRNDMQSYCLLFSSTKSESTRERLALLTKHNDGFLLAEKDLKLRGEGDVFGTRQSGLVEFKIATIHDTDIIESSKKWVEKTLNDTTGKLKTPIVNQRLEEIRAIHKE